jgi:hypothetical protein
VSIVPEKQFSNAFAIYPKRGAQKKGRKIGCLGPIDKLKSLSNKAR